MKKSIYFNVEDDLLRTKAAVRKAWSWRFRAEPTHNPKIVRITDELGAGGSFVFCTEGLSEDNLIACIAQVCFEKANPDKAFDFKLDDLGIAVIRE